LWHPEDAFLCTDAPQYLLSACLGPVKHFRREALVDGRWLPRGVAAGCRGVRPCRQDRSDLAGASSSPPAGPRRFGRSRAFGRLWTCPSGSLRSGRNLAFGRLRDVLRFGVPRRRRPRIPAGLAEAAPLVAFGRALPAPSGLAEASPLVAFVTCSDLAVLPPCRPRVPSGLAEASPLVAFVTCLDLAGAWSLPPSSPRRFGRSRAFGRLWTCPSGPRRSGRSLAFGRLRDVLGFWRVPGPCHPRVSSGLAEAAPLVAFGCALPVPSGLAEASPLLTFVTCSDFGGCLVLTCPSGPRRSGRSLAFGRLCDSLGFWRVPGPYVPFRSPPVWPKPRLWSPL
jgi:hypothetical protein